MAVHGTVFAKVEKDMDHFGFDVVKEISGRGYTTVFEVTKRCGNKRKQSLAVKRFKKSNSQSILNERIVHKRLELCAFIPSLYYECSTDTATYFFFEIMRGGNLLNFLHENGGYLSEYAVKPFLERIAMGIDELHKKKIIHRDVKLKNIVQDESGAPYITDFGSAKVFDEDEVETTVGMVGTVTHISPEMIVGKYSYETDWWSFGVCAYQMMTGEKPFSEDDDSYDDIKTRILEQDFYSSKLHSLSRNALDFLRRLLLKNPRQRLGANGVVEVLNHPFMAT